MHHEILSEMGWLKLSHDDIRALGFVPGATIEIITASSGALILRPVHVVPLELPALRVSGWRRLSEEGQSYPPACMPCMANGSRCTDCGKVPWSRKPVVADSEG